MGKDGIRRWPTWGKTIVFAVTKRHTETLAAMVDAHFADCMDGPTYQAAGAHLLCQAALRLAHGCKRLGSSRRTS